MASSNTFPLHYWCQNPLRSNLIMGIVNVTPDSFSDGGMYHTVDAAVKHALDLERCGADILDIGGESTRPNADPVSLDEELSRTIPVIQKIRNHSDCLISIDTTKVDVAKEALKNGAQIVNDISGLTYDKNLGSVVADYDAFLILMHMSGTPKTMQNDPKYVDIIDEIKSFLLQQTQLAIELGVDSGKIILDPGIGFGKTVTDNFILIGQLEKICDLGYPVLVGPSRKSFIGKTLNLPENEREEGTAAAVTAAILNGARIMRVHDVKSMKRVAIISEKIVEAA